MNNYKYKHEKHLVSVDCIIFGYEAEELKLLLFKRKLEPSKGGWSLVGGWVNNNESVEVAAHRVLNSITGLQNIFLEQIQAFSDPNRDPGGRVISIAFFAIIRLEDYNKKLVEKYDAHWIPLYKRPNLIFDHDHMVNAALEKLRQRARNEVFGAHLLPEKFTMLQLRNLYNTIYQKEFDPGNFRKKIISMNVLKKTNVKNTTESKKGAYYFEFKKDKNLKIRFLNPENSNH